MKEAAWLGHSEIQQLVHFWNILCFILLCLWEQFDHLLLNCNLFFCLGHCGILAVHLVDEIVSLLPMSNPIERDVRCESLYLHCTLVCNHEEKSTQPFSNSTPGCRIGRHDADATTNGLGRNMWLIPDVAVNRGISTERTNGWASLVYCNDVLM